MKILLICTVLFWRVLTGFTQTINVTTDQDLGFGSFCQISNAGGAVSISNTGTRSSSGDIALLGSPFFYSIFTITTDHPSPLTITIDQPTVTLSGSNGGSMQLQIGPANPGSPSVSSGFPAEVYIGGTLTVGPRTLNPPGTYTGNVLINFIVNNE